VKLLTGNDLPSGDVLWWTGSGWSRAIGDAADVGDGGETIAASEESARRVNAPYVIDAVNGLPAHIKDRIRAAGPTVRSDLGVNPTVPIAKA
jgi:hypothetical protein